MSERVNAKLYKIQVSEMSDIETNEAFINRIVDKYNKDSKCSFQQVQLNVRTNILPLKFVLFINTGSNKMPDWFSFVSSIVNDTDCLKNVYTKSSSFLLFVYNEENDNIFALARGQGVYVINAFIDNFFGVELFTKIVSREHANIKSVEERNILGAEIAALRYFKDDFTLLDNDDFGKIYKKLLTTIDESKFSELGIVKKKDSTKSLSMDCSRYFEVLSSFDFDEFVQRIKCISEILRTESEPLNQFYKVNRSELKLNSLELRNKLCETIFQYIEERKLFDFVYPDLLRYLKVRSVQFVSKTKRYELDYPLNYNSLELIDILVQNEIICIDDLESFIDSICGCTARVKDNEDYDFDGSVNIYDWFGGEIEYKGEYYFRIDKEWFKYKSGFDDFLNIKLQDIFGIMNNDKFLQDWNINANRTENSYNISYIGHNNFIVCDKKLVKNIELCDLIEIEDGGLCFYHIKKGLGRDIRVLASQIENSLKVLLDIKREQNYELLSEYYDKIVKGYYDNNVIRISDNTVTKENFLDLITKYNDITYIFAYSSSSSDTPLDEFKKSESRIAKFSLIHCYLEMRKLNIKFKVVKINEVNS